MSNKLTMAIPCVQASQASLAQFSAIQNDHIETSKNKQQCNFKFSIIEISKIQLTPTKAILSVFSNFDVRK